MFRVLVFPHDLLAKIINFVRIKIHISYENSIRKKLIKELLYTEK